MEGRRAPDLFVLGDLVLMQNFILKVRGPSKCLIGNPLKNWKWRRQTRRENHKWYFSFCRHSSLPLVHFWETCLVFWGSPPLRARAQRRVSFGHFPGITFGVFSVQGRFVGFRGARCSPFSHREATSSHTFVQIGATRLPTRQQIGSPGPFPPPSGVGFRTTFWYFFVSWEL